MENKEFYKQEFLRLAKEHSKKFNKEITRDFYRSHATICMSDFEKMFGEFGKFKRTMLVSAQRKDNEIIKKLDKKCKKFIVSTVVEGSPYNVDFFKAIQNWCKINNGECILLWQRGVRFDDSFNAEQLELIKPYLASEVQFNSNLKAQDFLLHPAQLLPLSGLQRFGQKDASLIIASTKQMLTTVARERGKRPRILYATGTISIPQYSKTRIGSLAGQDNDLGGLVVEIQDDKKFFVRNIQWIKDGFVDLGIKYKKDNKEKVKCKALVMGDLHLTEEDPESVKISIEQSRYLKSEKVFLHDLISFNSISHHLNKSYLTKTIAIPTQFNSLEKEFVYAKEFLNGFKKKVNGDIIVVASNHASSNNDFLYRYCNEGNFIKDINNNIFAAKCFIDFCERKNPIEKYINDKDIVFLKDEQSCTVEGYECGYHGHLGANGGKINVRSYSNYFPKSVIGHAHSSSIHRNIFQVGTNSRLKLSYNSGASNWGKSNCAIYAGGYVQLISWIEEKWKLDN